MYFAGGVVCGLMTLNTFRIRRAFTVLQMDPPESPTSWPVLAPLRSAWSALGKKAAWVYWAVWGALLATAANDSSARASVTTVALLTFLAFSGYAFVLLTSRSAQVGLRYARVARAHPELMIEAQPVPLVVAGAWLTAACFVIGTVSLVLALF